MRWPLTGVVGTTLSEMPESDSVFSQMAKGNERARACVCVLVALRGVGVGMEQGHPFQESRHHNPVVLSGDELAFSAPSAGVLCTHVVYTCHGLWVSWLHPPYPFCTLLTPPPQNLTPFTSDDVRNSLCSVRLEVAQPVTMPTNSTASSLSLMEVSQPQSSPPSHAWRLQSGTLQTP